MDEELSLRSGDKIDRDERDVIGSDSRKGVWS